MIKKLSAIIAGWAVLAGALAGAAETTKIVVDGSTTVGPIAKAFAEYYMSEHPGVNITVSESGSGNGAKALVNSACDVASMSRFMKDTEFQAAIEKGILPVAHVVAMDGLPVLVHPSNPIDGLTKDQVKAIFQGKIANWKEVGGPDVKIVKISRDSNSGTYETFHTIVMNEEDLAAEVEYVGSNGAIRERVQSTPAAIGYAGLAFVDDTVKALAIDGIMPNVETVSLGTYPISRPLYLFTNGYPKLGSALFQFVTLHLRPKGQEIVEAVGFVPVTSY
ncbi:MAG: Phosphate-binding protein PstS 1 precursor [candidate division BRC1 bacterium ADurb.BinA364]|nr:MAG: Phosphate-binding protein PstS 1 precursor [candidate division BRC1 bacterium ADurb.BinA364]